MVRLKCPKCATVVEQFGENAPTCPNCGFGKAGSRTPDQAGLTRENLAVRTVNFGRPGDRFPPERVVGKPRGFQSAFPMSLLTFPVTGVLYHHKAFRELDLQADRPVRVSWSVLAGMAWAIMLGAAVTYGLTLAYDANSNLVWVWFGIAAGFAALAQLFLVVHVASGLDRLAEDRATYGIEGGLKPGLVYTMMTVGMLFGVGPFLAMDHVRRNINRVQAAVYRARGLALPAWCDVAYPPEAAPEPAAAPVADDDGYGAMDGDGSGEGGPDAEKSFLDPADMEGEVGA